MEQISVLYRLQGSAYLALLIDEDISREIKGGGAWQADEATGPGGWMRDDRRMNWVRKGGWIRRGQADV